jgi:uncharacterized protein
MNQASSAANPTAGPLDMHVHLVGNGLSGSGCRLRSRWWLEPFVRAMARNVGLIVNPRSPDFDRAYLECLEAWTRSSSLEKVVVLACDNVYQANGQPRFDLTALFVPNVYVLKAARNNPALLAGVSIHPARSDALDELDRCVEAGAVLLKLLPCVQIVDPGLTAYRKFWTRLAELGLPLLAHTGGEFSLPTYRRDLQNPECLRAPLECGVNVVAAHCGSPALPWDRDYGRIFDRMRKEFPNFFGDLSALSQPMHLRTLARLRADPAKILHGSDYPVLTSGIWSKLKGWISGDDYRLLRALKNPLERKYQLTRALGFPSSVFTDAWKLFPASPMPRIAGASKPAPL